MHVLRCTGDAESLEDLLAAADTAVCLPAADMTAYAIEAAARRGTRIVASPTDANLAALSQTKSVTWCVAGDRAAASRAVLQSIEATPVSAAIPIDRAANPYEALDALYRCAPPAGARLAAQ
jgi:hypothetical protein